MTKIAFNLNDNDIKRLSELLELYGKEVPDERITLSELISYIIEYTYIQNLILNNNILSFTAYKKNKNSLCD